jgi:hypothetical protein
VIIVVAVVALLCCAGAVGGGFWLFSTVQGVTSPARDAATAYLDDVRAGDHSAAYARLCQRLRDRSTEEEFTRARRTEPPLGRYRVTDTTVNTDNGVSRAEVTVTAGGQERVVVLVMEADQWRVCGD